MSISPAPPETSLTSNEVKQVIVIRKDLMMRKGKMAAQAAHASMKFLLDDVPNIKGTLMIKELTPEEMAWLHGSFTKVVVSVDSEKELLEVIVKAQNAKLSVHSITDAGRTEFKGIPTLTCAAIGPHEAWKIDTITGSLKLL